MKRFVTAILVTGLLAASAVPAFAHEGHSASEPASATATDAHTMETPAEASHDMALHVSPPVANGPAVVVNGQPLISFGHRGPHYMNSHVYVAVEDFAWMTGTTYSYSAEQDRLTFNGKLVSSDFRPLLPVHENALYAPVKVLGELLDGGKVEWLDVQKTVVISFDGQTTAQKLGLPAGVARISPLVPGMGEHWANPANLPTGPIYVVANAKVIGWEFMIGLDELNAGKNWTNVGLVNTGATNHVDIEFQPHGHEGFPGPHYDIHAYTITPEEKALIK
jgi:hypothetical protein